MPGEVFEFGDFKLDVDCFHLSRGARTLKLERKPLELLLLLAASNGQLVTRTEIAQHLWGSEVYVDTEHGINSSTIVVTATGGSISHTASVALTVQ